MRKRLVIATLTLFTCGALHAQSIVTIAGGGSDDGRPAREAAISPYDVAIDSAGNVFIADYFNFRIRRVTPGGTILTAVGNGSEARGRDDIPVAGASLGSPTSVVITAAGDLYFADPGYQRIRKVTAATGIIRVVAGGGEPGFSGDNGPATAARLNDPEGIAVDGSGNLFIADTNNHRIRKVDPAGVITTIAGTGTAGYAGDNGLATAALLSSPRGIAVASNGDVLIADSGNHAVRRIRSGTITTVAGTGSSGLSGDNGPASAARLNAPRSVAVDANGILYVADTGNDRVRRIDANNNITTFAGGGSGFGEGGTATAATLNSPRGVTVDRTGNVFIADTENSAVRRVNVADSTIHTVAGNRQQSFYGGGDGGPAAAASFKNPQFLAVDSAGNLYIAERNGWRVRKVFRSTGTITTVAGTGDAGYRGDGGPATQASIRAAGVAIDALGNLYISDYSNHVIRRVSATSQIITTFAGSGTAGSSGDGGVATAARLNEPHGMAVDPSGTFLYVSDSGNHKIRRIDLSSMIINTVAGNGTAGFSGDSGPATQATLNLNRSGIGFDPAGDLYIADSFNHRIRKVTMSSGTITTVAGSGTGPDGSLQFGGDGGPALQAKLARPRDVFVDESSNLYIVDAHNSRLRKVDLGSGIITTIAGTGQYDFLGDGGPATQARLAFPWAGAVDSSGNIYISDTDNNRVRAIFACVSVGSPSLSAPANGAANVSTGATLRWNRVEGAFRYDVYLDTNPNPTRSIATDVTATSATAANLAAGTRYYWRVEAKGDSYCSPLSRSSSQVISFTTAGGCNAPASFALSAPSEGALDIGSSTSLSWQPASGAVAFDLFLGTKNPPPFLMTTTSTSAPVTGLAAGTTYSWFVRARSACDKATTTPVRTFKTAGSCNAAGAFTLLAPASGATAVSTNVLLSWAPSANASSYDLYFGTSSAPPLYLSDLTRTSVMLVGLAPSERFSWKVEAKSACNGATVSSATATFTTGAACNAPAAPAITFVPPGNVAVGQSYVITWSEADGLDADGVYLVERSIDGFGSVLDSQQAFGTSASFVSTAAGSYQHRVRAIQSCAPAAPGPASAARTVNVVAAAPNVVFTVQPQAVISALGENLEYYKTLTVVENLGSLPLQVILGRQEINSVPFFRVVDPSGSDAAFLTLEPRKPKTLEIRYSGPPNDRAASYQGVIFLAATGQGLAITPYAFVNLKVGGGESAKPLFLVNGKPAEYTFFPGFAGDDSTRQPISVVIQNPGTTPMELAAEIAPEVWLRPENGWNATPIAAGGSRSIQLFTDRSRAPNGSALPRYTYFTVRSKNGETARLLVQDNDALAGGSGRNTQIEAGRRSYVIPGAISDGTSVTRLRLTNLGTEAVQAEMFFTPSSADGFDATAVKRVAIVIPPNDVVTLTDPMQQLFAIPPPSAGQLEIRASADRIGQLLIAAMVITPASTGGAYTYQLPALRSGEGAAAGAAHVIAGVTAGVTGQRSTLLMTETTGMDAVRVRATLYDNQGSRKGEITESITRFGQKAIDLTTLSAGSTIDGGRIALVVESGGGAAAGIVTMLDETRKGGPTLVSQPVSGGPGSSSARLRILQNVVTAVAVAPLVVNSTTTRTAMGFTLTGGSSTTAIVTYRPSIPGSTAIEKTLPLFPNVALQFENVLEQLFGIASGAKAEGSLFVRAAEGSQIYARMQALSGGKWSATGSLPIFGSLSDVVTSIASRRPLYLDGLEQSVEASRGARWNVILSETGGVSGSVRVRLFEAGNRRLPIAEGVFALGAYEQVKLESVFAALGLESEERRKDRTNVLCMVTPEGGGAVISAVGVSTDNVTGDTRHHLFSPTGGVPATGVVRITTVRQVDPPPSVNRRRASRP